MQQGVVLEGLDVVVVSRGEHAEDEARALLLQHLAHARGTSLHEPASVLAARTRAYLPAVTCEEVRVEGVVHVRCRLPQLAETRAHARSGATLATLAPWLDGEARVEVVESTDAAYAAGLRAGDRLRSVNDASVVDAPTAVRLLDACRDTCVVSYEDAHGVRRTARLTR